MRFLILGLLAFLAAPARAESAAPCPPYELPVVLEFEELLPEPTYDYTLSTDEIQGHMEEANFPLAGLHQRAYGMTDVQSVLAIDGKSWARHQQAGGHCVYLDHVTAKFGWQRMNVYVAGHLKPESCEHDAVRDHENDHIAVSVDLLREFAPQVRAKLEALIKEQKPVFTHEPDAVGDALVADLDKRMAPMLADFQALHALRNAPLDSVGSYRATMKRCAGWQPQPPAKARRAPKGELYIPGYTP